MSESGTINTLIVSRLQRGFEVGRHGMSCPATGMTLIELMIALTVLAIGLPACVMMILVGMQSNSRSKTDTTATILSQEIIEKFSTLKQYPKPTFIAIYDCALSSASGNVHNASLGAGVAPAGSGSALYTGASASDVGNIDWTQPAPPLATSTTQGYAMQYQTCSGDIYEVRWNVMAISPNPNSRISLLTASARPRSAVQADAGGATNRAILYARPVTLKTLIEN
jgi:prepilin-type N-terminal cleavage/methylation domain-containing protein